MFFEIGIGHRSQLVRRKQAVRVAVHLSRSIEIFFKRDAEIWNIRERQVRVLSWQIWSKRRKRTFVMNELGICLYTFHKLLQRWLN